MEVLQIVDAGRCGKNVQCNYNVSYRGTCGYSVDTWKLFLWICVYTCKQFINEVYRNLKLNCVYPNFFCIGCPIESSHLCSTETSFLHACGYIASCQLLYS